MGTSVPATTAGEWVVLICTDPNRLPEPDDDQEETMTISTEEINNWDISSILRYQVIKIKAYRSRLIEQSTYFRGLLSGNFSESALTGISIQWDQQTFLILLTFMFGYPVDVTSTNFIPLFETALFFGLDMLLVTCKRWLVEMISANDFPLIQLHDLNHIWMFGLESANESIPELCTSYLAKNFMWAMSSDSFGDVPYDLLLSCIRHSHLTIDSEKHLSDALLLWVAANTKPCEEDNCFELFKQIRLSLLPLGFVAGKRNCQYFSEFADEGIKRILTLVKQHSTSLLTVLDDGDVSNLRIRLTEFTKQVDLSGCPQLKPAILFLSLLPLSDCLDRMLRKRMKQSLINYERLDGKINGISWNSWQTLTFSAVQKVDISCCPLLDLEAAIEFFSKSFPYLTTLKAAHFLSFRTTKLCQLISICPLLSDVDLTVDLSPMITEILNSSSCPATTPRVSTSFDPSAFSLLSLSPYTSRPLLSNVTTLTLEGRTDFSDSDLQNISEMCVSLCYLNIKGCMLLTDAGIAVALLKCVKLHSIMVCYTHFGQQSILALCSSISTSDNFAEKQTVMNNSKTPASKLQMLHMSGCKGISESSFSKLMSQTYMLKSLCVREIQVVEEGLCIFSGSFLEVLDVSNTKVSASTVSHIVRRNPNLKHLETRGCMTLSQQETKGDLGKSICEELYSEVGRSCKLEELAVGWGFSLFSLEAIRPALLSLSALTVGLGGSLGLDGLDLLPSACPLLKSLVLYFQVISDAVIMNVLVSLKHLEMLSLCYCLGEISSLSFNFDLPNLKKLKLERVAPWMTNVDLVNLTHNCPSLTELSLLGCRCLNSESQEIISSGWPGLISIHLEECGEVTRNGVTSLFECKALEDILLRHNGAGIQENVVIDAASKLPMLRKVSLDLCDAKDGYFNLPSFSSRYFLSNVKIAKCKHQKSGLDLQMSKASQKPVHKETLVLVWNSKDLSQTVVRERL